ncbi:MAG: hypothetical protein IJ573_00785 [Clostridia bacterium]|nr:hypothetical protein [Clostridia bacterium]
MNQTERYDAIQSAFDARYRRKKLTNLAVSAVIAVLGITSFLYGLTLESIRTIFRWMTVDGTVFTTIGSIVCIAVNLVEIARQTEVTRRPVYFIRLSCAVAESVIFIVVVFSQLPFFAQHLPVFDRYDSFVMHVVIPILGVSSFLLNDSPIGRLTPAELWHGTAFVSCYAATVLILIAAGMLPSHLIPYFFLDYRQNGLGLFLVAFAFIYLWALLMARRLSEWNRRLSWLWFKDIARIK